MDLTKLEKRNSTLDIIRLVAVTCVFSIHFFLHTGFYSQPLEGVPMYIMTLMRTAFSVCVPMFMILTGYLMNKKTLSKQYYSGIIKLVVVFVLASIACMVFKAIHGDVEDFTIRKLILGIFDFSDANYSWYIEMYIGLFLIIPFLNLAYNKLKNQRQKQVLVLTLFALSIMPTIFNIYSFESLSWWNDQTSADSLQKLIPSWWMGIYPIAYYYVGCYLREFGLRFKTISLAVMLALSIGVFGTLNFLRCYGTNFKVTVNIFWYGFEPYILSVLLFSLLLRIKTDKIHKIPKLILWKLSDLVMGMFLVSFIFDSLIYEQLKNAVPEMTDRLPYFFLTVPIVFVCSAIGAFIIDLIARGIIFAGKKIIEFVKAERAKNEKRDWQTSLFCILLGLGVGFLVWKCYFGVNDYEAFYLSIPHRLLQGDGLFADEWHLTQMSGVLLVPFVWIFETVTGSADGMILAARFMYVFCHSLIAVFAYSRLKKYGILSVAGCMFFLLFTPFEILSLNYNTMGIDLLVLGGVMLATTKYDKKLTLIISGLCFAGAVLCCPTLIAVYVLFAICVVLHIILRNSKLNLAIKSQIFAPKTFLFFTIGAVIVAIGFATVAILGSSADEILRSFAYIFADPEHEQISIFSRIINYFSAILTTIPLFNLAIYAFLGLCVVMAADTKRFLHRSVYLLASIGIMIYSLVLIVPSMTSSGINYILFPMIFVGITSYVLCKNKPREIFLAVFMVGVLYSICFGCVSNQGFEVIACSMTVANLAGFVFLGQLLKEMKESSDNIAYSIWFRRLSIACAALVIAIEGGMMIGAKANYVSEEDSVMSEMTYQLNYGPFSGIKTSDTNGKAHDQILEDADTFMQDINGENLLILSNKSWIYLAESTSHISSYSAWLPETSESFFRLIQYYAENPDKTPTYVYIPKDSDWNVSKIMTTANQYGYSVFENNISYQLTKIS